MKPCLPACLVLVSLSSLWPDPALAADLFPAAAPLSSSLSSERPLAVVGLHNPRGLAVDRTGNLYVADIDARKLYKVTPAGEVNPLTVPADRAPVGLAIDLDGALVVADAEYNAVYATLVSGEVKSLVTRGGEANFNAPTMLAVDIAGNRFVANNLGHTVLRITPDGTVSVFAGVADQSGGTDGAASEARFNTPLGLALDAAGNLYVADKDNSNIRKITPAGVVSTVAGVAGQSGSADGVGAQARFAEPRAIAVDSSGTLFVADTNNQCIRKITTDGVVSTFAGQAGQAGYFDGVGKVARFNDPRGIAVDGRGNVYVADGGNGAVRLISPDGTVKTIVAAAAPGAEPPPTLTGPAPLLPPRSGETERVDYSQAQTFDGWEGDPTYWSVKDGVFSAKGEKVPSTFLLTQKAYSDFRLTLRSQMVVSENHAGVCLWGERPIGIHNQWSYKGPLVIFPGLSLWDYRTNRNIPIDPVGKALAKKITSQHDWIQVEILAQGNRLRVAYNGQQVLDWREPDPSSLKTGPIGLQLHGYTKPQEVAYKDVVIESFPKEDRLITVKE